MWCYDCRLSYILIHFHIVSYLFYVCIHITYVFQYIYYSLFIFMLFMFMFVFVFTFPYVVIPCSVYLLVFVCLQYYIKSLYLLYVLYLFT